MPFSAFGLLIEPILEEMQKFGIIEHCEPAPAHTKEVGEKIILAMKR
jgi:hypothetical protein